MNLWQFFICRAVTIRCDRLFVLASVRRHKTLRTNNNSTRIESLETSVLLAPLWHRRFPLMEWQIIYNSIDGMLLKCARHHTMYGTLLTIYIWNDIYVCRSRCIHRQCIMNMDSLHCRAIFDDDVTITTVRRIPSQSPNYA